jgi:hypothetical protein
MLGNWEKQSLIRCADVKGKRNSMTNKKIRLSLLLTLCVAGATGQGVAIASEQEHGHQQASNLLAPASYDAPRGGSTVEGEAIYHGAPPFVITRSAAEISQWLGSTGSPVDGTSMIETGSLGTTGTPGAIGTPGTIGTTGTPGTIGTTGTPGYGTRAMGTTNTSGYGAGMDLRDGIDLYGVTGGRWGATGDEVAAYGVDTERGSHWLGLLGAIGLIGLAGINRSKSLRSKR